jgi:RNA-directed DNA polymerase
MNEREKSDSPMLPRKLPNRGWGALQPAKGVEVRGLAEGNSLQQTRFRTEGLAALQSPLGRIRQEGRKGRKLKFTALWHHTYQEEWLWEAYFELNRTATPGVDGQTWQQYVENLDGSFRSLATEISALWRL